jgi:hypothetical protein
VEILVQLKAMTAMTRQLRTGGSLRWMNIKG